MKYNLAIVDNLDCNCINNESKSCDEEKFPNRNTFITDCIPLINLKDGNKNILDWRRDNGYIYFNPNNRENYYLDTNFNLTRYDGEIKFDQHSLDLLKELYSKLNYDIVISTNSNLSENNSQSASSNQSDRIKIPIYYLYCNKNNEIFNIFITQCIMKYSDFKKFGDLFRINNEDNTFITLSYKFNIFNISLLCGKFFDIIPLFFDEYSQDEIIERLNKIFHDFNFVNLYTTINNYKFNLKNLSILKDDIYEIVINSKLKVPIPNIKKNSNKAKKINSLINIETNSYKNKDTQDRIIEELAESIIQIRNTLKDLNYVIPDFDKLFLMSILSYRLKEGLINTTWPFNIESIRIYIIRNSELTELDNQRLKSIYSMNKPIIYEYSQITYKKETYGNCMESTILQLLKIFFCNPNIENFDDNIIKKIVKDEYVDFIIDIFKRIELEERTTLFDLSWVEFITELPSNRLGDIVPLELLTNDLQPRQYLDSNLYDFLRKDKELNPTLANLILSLKCLTKIEYKPEDTPTTFLNSIIKIINSNYSIITSSEQNKDIVIINCYSNYTMKLTHNTHAMFESAKINKSGLLNILENIKLEDKSLIKYLQYNSYLTYSDMTNYIYLFSLVENIDIFKKYITLLTKEKKQSYFNLIYSDSVISKISTEIFDSIFINDVDITYFENFQFWLIVFVQIKSDNFWRYIIKYDIFRNWNQKLFKSAIILIKSDIFWQDYINTNIYEGWLEDIWESVILNIKSDNFWEEIGKRDIYNIKWSDKLKLLAIRNIKSDKFWEYIIRNNIYYNWNYNLWENVTRYIRSDFFWNNINIDAIEDEKIKEIIIKKKSNYKNKYLKYKMKYLELKTKQ